MTTPKDKSQEGPYSTKPLQLLRGHAWVTLNGHPVIRGRDDQGCDAFPTGQALRIRDQLNAAYAAGQAAQWNSLEEQTPDGDVLLAGPAYNNPSTGEYWQRVGFYSNRMLYANDEFDPWDGYPPTHWMPLPLPPSNP